MSVGTELNNFVLTRIGMRARLLRALEATDKCALGLKLLACTHIMLTSYTLSKCGTPS